MVEPHADPDHQPDPDLGRDLELALELADVADRLTMEAIAGDFSVTTKSDGSPVTDVDVRVETVMRDLLGKHRPADGIIGEELGGSAGDGRRWILDPIDGTGSFARRGTVWGTLIALEIDQRPAVGVVSMPARDSRWWGAIGVGAFASTPQRRETTPLGVAAPDTTASARCACVPAPEELDGDERLTVDRLATLGHLVPYAEWTTYPALMVAGGTLDACIHVGAHWDLAALGAIVLAAGGTFHDDRASRRPRHAALFTTPEIEARALQALGW